jgi:hypothetical protein
MNIFKPFLSAFLLLFVSLNCSSQDSEDERIFEDQIHIKLSFYKCHRGKKCPAYEIAILGNGTVLYEGHRDVAKMGIHQKQIKKQKLADLLTMLLRNSFFEREDTSTTCNLKVEVTAGGAYEEIIPVCVTSSHGPSTFMDIKFGNNHRKLRLEGFFSEDYIKIKQKIIETAGVEKWIKKK